MSSPRQSKNRDDDPMMEGSGSMEVSAFVMLRGEVANLRNDLKSHERSDSEKFDALTKALNEMNAELQRYVGGVQMAAWSLGICLPIIATAVIADVVRHWSSVTP